MTDQWVVTRGEEEWKEGKMGKGVICIVMDGNQTFGGEHYIIYTDVEL